MNNPILNDTRRTIAAAISGTTWADAKKAARCMMNLACLDYPAEAARIQGDTLAALDEYHRALYGTPCTDLGRFFFPPVSGQAVRAVS